MKAAVVSTPKHGVSQGGMKLARLLSLREGEFSEKVRRIEDSPLFRVLRDAAVVSLYPYSNVRFAHRRYPGLEPRASVDGFSELLSEDGKLLRLITRIGRESFEEHFLGEETDSAAHCARSCGISVGDVAELRDFVNRLYIKGEFSRPAEPSAPRETCSPVAGIGLENGLPFIEYFHRDIWKGRYKVNSRRLSILMKSYPIQEARRLEQFARELEYMDRRKTTLYRTLEAVVAGQTKFLVSGDTAHLRPLTQRTVAARIGAGPSVLNALILGKSVRLPWGVDIPLKALMPSPKSLLRERLRDIIMAHPGLPDEGLRREINRRQGSTLSRRSVTQYRKELGLGCRMVFGRRAEIRPVSKRVPVRR